MSRRARSPRCLPWGVAQCEPAEPSAEPRAPIRRQLLDAAHTRRTERRQRAEHERAEARAQHLAALAREAESLWQQVEAHIATKKAGAYDAAVTLLAELRDAYAHTGRDADFHKRLTRLREYYQRRPGVTPRPPQPAMTSRGFPVRSPTRSPLTRHTCQAQGSSVRAGT